MPATRRSVEAGALKPLSDNVIPLSTPGKKVVALKAELEKKDAENEALRKSISELTNALAGLNVVREKIETDGTTGISDVPKKKKDKDAPVPPKTAYKFYCGAHPKHKEGVNMLQVWKECAPEIRQSYDAMAKADKDRYAREIAAYQEEKTALDMYYEKKKQDMAMELLDAHLTAQAALEKVDANKKGKKKAKKDPEAPKRPLSSYMYFVSEMRESATKNNPNAAPKEVMKILGETWNQLEKGKNGKKGTKKYDDLAAVDRARYEGEKKVYDSMIEERNKQSEQQKLDRLEKEKGEAMELMKIRQDATATVATEAPKTVAIDDMSIVSGLSANNKTKTKKKKDPNAPKKASNAYLFFLNQNRAEIKADLPEGTANNEVLAEAGRQWKALTDTKREKYAKMANNDKERYAKEMEKYRAEKNFAEI
eukprot:CAMPEP_0172554610 /NCGR_PEP_ID=MMETSP1067-20121228/55476_1 /TAXON_ID=265564 ORGANISM="Thalassiosira punctigera, Strain Tpunct2005C2" /NCGR_SAMPLE_ID=MMETSP1067 /ASSEMBLY_ACC=CAM_ASM_000444 /LENGTH=423 /DNA_ID=CAMNT_0013343013 /DNA_START=46 /DNA_END=1317 /DNA_ORIENTATION=+